MSSIEDIRTERLRKLQVLRERGINPYPATSFRDRSCEKFLVDFDSLAKGLGKATLAGRIMALRRHGGSTFLDLYDGTAKVQCFLREEDLGKESHALFGDCVDASDFIEVSGTAYTTKRGEKTLLAASWRMLAKSLRPVPDAWYGLHDEDERYRKRYLDLLLDPSLKEMFVRKARFWEETRIFLKGEGFLEVETPTLEVTTGGAEARPFRTHHNDFDIDLYLRISVGELWQKRLMAAGFPRTFEIGRLYRNEGTSAEHVQEFTNLEFYAAYMDYRAGMLFTEKLTKEVVSKTFGTMKFETRGFKLDLEGQWNTLEYVPTVKRMCGIDVLIADERELRKKLEELKVAYVGTSRERLADSLWKHCRKQIAGPTWIINPPKLVSPLAKAIDDKPDMVQRVQLILAGAEVTNGYSELNDPVDQAERFKEQQRLIEAGDEEAMMEDTEFVEMLEYGMPPAFGFAYGDRLFAILENKAIRETQLFPLMRPRR